MNGQQPPPQPPVGAQPVPTAAAPAVGQPAVAAPQPTAAPVAAPPPAVAGAGATPVAATQVEEWPTGDLPEQTGQGGRTALAPAIYAFRLPMNLAQLWASSTYKDFRKVLANGQPNPTLGQQVPFHMLKLGKDSPLVVEGGPANGEPMTSVFNTIRMPRGPFSKRDDPLTPWIHDLAYILEVCLGDTSRPQSVEDLVAQINQHAGGLIRLTIGRKGECRVDAVRYIPQQRTDKASGALVPMSQGFDTVADPSGQKGCGKKYWTKDYAGAENVYQASVQCDPAKGGCGAMIRGFENVEGFLPALASA